MMLLFIKGTWFAFRESNLFFKELMLSCAILGPLEFFSRTYLGQRKVLRSFEMVLLNRYNKIEPYRNNKFFLVRESSSVLGETGAVSFLVFARGNQ